jgi:hypothetical protein
LQRSAGFGASVASANNVVLCANKKLMSFGTRLMANVAPRPRSASGSVLLAQRALPVPLVRLVQLALPEASPRPKP